MAQESKDLPPEFFDLVDQFVNLANSQSKSYPPSRVSSAIMYAAARYNAYAWASHEPNREEILEDVVEYYRSQYEAMFRENVREMTA